MTSDEQLVPGEQLYSLPPSLPLAYPTQLEAYITQQPSYNDGLHEVTQSGMVHVVETSYFRQGVAKKKYYSACYFKLEGVYDLSTMVVPLANVVQDG